MIALKRRTGLGIGIAMSIVLSPQTFNERRRPEQEATEMRIDSREVTITRVPMSSDHKAVKSTRPEKLNKLLRQPTARVDLSVHKQKSHSYIFHYCISELSMIQIGCLLVGQTLNITILSLSPPLLLLYVFFRFELRVFVSLRVVNRIVNSIIKQNYARENAR